MTGSIPLLTAALLGESSFWFGSSGASTASDDIDRLFHFILWVSVVCFVFIVGVMVAFMWWYRRKPGEEPGESPHHNNTLEITWTVLPSLILVVIFAWGFIGYVSARTPPANAYEIQVTAEKWAWSFTYPNGYQDTNLHVPIDRPVRLVMTSRDVIHSFYVPGFRVKMDIVPGRYTTTWFQATETGDYRIYCAEYCGTKHSEMVANVIVHPAGEFEPWLAEAGDILKNLSPVEAGERLYKLQGCSQCHSIDGTAKVGPSFKGIFGTEQQMTGGSTVTVDENYIRESILEPGAKVRAGYPNKMASYQGRLSDGEITALIAYIKSLQ